MSLGDDDDTPVIDEGLAARANQIDWTPLLHYPPNIIVCKHEHAPYRSHAKYDLVAERIVARLGCPVCHSHEARSSMDVGDGEITSGEIETREKQTITAGDIGELEKILGGRPDDDE